MEEPVHQERTVTLAVPLEIAAESRARLAGTVLRATMGGGDSARPFTLKNLEAARKFLGLNILP